MKKLKQLALAACILVGYASTSFAQNVGINSDGSTPDNSAILDVKSTGKGFLAPRMTQSQREAISSPATGLLVFQTDGTAGFYYNAGTTGSPNWIMLSSSSFTETDPEVGTNTTNYLSKWDGTQLVASNVSDNGTTVDVGSRNLTVGSSGQLQVSNAGNITKINNVTTSFPSSQGAANSVLQNNGAGSLSWNTSPIIGNSYITPDGGLAVKLTAGEALVRGNVVRGAGDGKAYKTSTTSPENVFGIVYQDASANGEVYIVTTGSAYVLFEAATTNGVWAGVSSTNAGKAYVLTTMPAGNTEHDREVGHPMEVISSAGLAKCIIHFR